MDIERHQARKQLSFAVYGATNRLVRMHKPILEPLGLTFPQYLVMLEMLDSAPLTVGELGARLAMDTGTITPLVKRLEQAGRLVRRRDKEDERRVFVELTPEGDALRQAIWGVPNRINSACQISIEEAEALRTAIDALAR